jgi:hypothetical protein
MNPDDFKTTVEDYHYGKISKKEYTEKYDYKKEKYDLKKDMLDTMEKICSYDDLKMTEKITLNAVAEVELEEHTTKRWILCKDGDKVVFSQMDGMNASCIRYQLFTDDATIEERRGTVVDYDRGRRRWKEFIEKGWK